MNKVLVNISALILAVGAVLLGLAYTWKDNSSIREGQYESARVIKGAAIDKMERNV